MSRPTANLRLFVAIYPPPDARSAMLALLEPLDLPRHRPTPAEQVHMTVQFIGDTPSREIDAVRESVERSVAGVAPFALCPQRLITLPQRGPARLVALETDLPPGLAEIQRRLVTRLASDPRRERDFTPHITLCRFAHETRGAPVDHPVRVGSFPVGAVHLMRSTLKPTGAVHEVVREFVLGR